MSASFSVLAIVRILASGRLDSAFSGDGKWLLETHSDADLDVALATDAEVIGVNARDLETLEVDAGRARRHLARIPAGRIGVLESGIATREDVVAAVEAGASAILVGEALMRATDPRAVLRGLLGEETHR